MDAINPNTRRSQARTPPERAVQRNVPDTDIKVLYCFHQNNDDSKCEVGHTSHSLIPNKTRQRSGSQEGTHGTETKTS
jgi:hypothetical protein